MFEVFVPGHNSLTERDKRFIFDTNDNVLTFDLKKQTTEDI